MKGAEEATGDYIWIAEADDLADANFLREMEKTMEENTGLSFCCSNIIDKNTKMLDSYDNLDYLKQTNIDWSKNKVFSDHKDKSDLLGIRNTILNVSSTLIKRDLILEPLNDLVSNKRMRYCGDWYTYIEIAGDIAYLKSKLNYHRRHEESVTAESFKNDHFIEMEEFIRLLLIHSILSKSKSKSRSNLETTQSRNIKNRLDYKV